MANIDPVWLHWPQTRTLIEIFGERLRFVGGCARDALLNREVRDVDAATILPPQEVMALLKAHGIKAVPTGIDHGTVTAVAGEHHFEITTLRRDVSTDGRRATVAFTDDWKEDAARRDFTMNALYVTAAGDVIDYFGGVEDAKAGRVRFIGEAATRIEEDALRILRFFRFFAHYGADPVDEKGLMACAELAERVDGLSGERISAEMLKLLTAEKSAHVVGLMQRSEVWRQVVPHTVKTESLALLPAALRKAGRGADPILALALLLRTIKGDAKAAARALAARWKLSKAHAHRLNDLCEPGTVACSGKEQHDVEWKKAIRALGKPLFADRVILALAEGAEEATCLKALALAQSWDVPPFPVTGEDLKKHGIAQGKALGEWLATLEALWEEQGYQPDKAALLAQIKSAR